jgi:hypothetical protein
MAKVHAGYDVSQRKRKLVEQAFGWMKTVGLLRKLHHRGGPLVEWAFTFHAAAYNLVRLRTLLARPEGLDRVLEWPKALIVLSSDRRKSSFTVSNCRDPPDPR